MIILAALQMAFAMFWEVLWPLVFGFLLSAIVQALVSHDTLVKTLGDDSPKSLFRATVFGIAASSCSYAAVALARSLFTKGSSFTAAQIFTIASTNLVIELGIIVVVLLGWQFALAEYFGGVCMIILLSLLFRATLSPALVSSAKQQATKGILGKMEGHAAMDMHIAESGSFWHRLFSLQGFTTISHYFVMDFYGIWQDTLVRFCLAGLIAVLVPETIWHAVFLHQHPFITAIEGPLVGPLIAIVSFVCSVGNIPLAAVLWHGGLSFGGVVSFIFADLLILPILAIYRKYYGKKLAWYLFITFYAAMAGAGFLVEFTFAIFHLTPHSHTIGVLTQGAAWNYTTWLNITFLIIGILLIWRFFTTNGIEMLRMMASPKHEMANHHHH